MSDQDQNPDPPIATITPAQAEEGHSKSAPKEKPKVFTELTDEEMQVASACCAASFKLCCSSIFLMIYIVICQFIPLVLIVVGYYFIGDCPDQTALPHLLIYYGVLLIIASAVKFIDSAVHKRGSKIVKNVVTATLLILYVIIVIVHIYGLYLVIDVFFREDPVCSRVLQWFSFLVFVVASFFLAFVCCCISGMGCLYCMKDKILEWAERNGVPPETLDKYRKTVNQNQN